MGMLIKFYGGESLDNSHGLRENTTEKAIPKEGHLFLVN